MSKKNSAQITIPSSPSTDFARYRSGLTVIVVRISNLASIAGFSRRGNQSGILNKWHACSPNSGTCATYARLAKLQHKHEYVHFSNSL